MLKLKIIALILSLLMTLQMLPIAQIGSMLSSNQWTEELPHNQSDEAGKADASKNTPFLPAEHNILASELEASKAMIRIHISASIPSNHSTDIVSPPPDVMA